MQIFFSPINSWPIVFSGFASVDKARTANLEQCFSSMVRNPRMPRAICMHCSVPFYIGN